MLRAVRVGKPWREGLPECYVERLDALKKYYYDLCDMRADLVSIREGLSSPEAQHLFYERPSLSALSKDMRAKGVPPHWLSYITVTNVDETAKKAAQNGGKVMMEPFDVMDVGRMAGVQDPTGAPFAMWQAKKHIG